VRWIRPSADSRSWRRAAIEKSSPDPSVRGVATPVGLASIETARAVIAWFAVKKYEQGEAVSAMTRMLMKLRAGRLEVVA
jgi:hypothetical protein